MREGVEFQAMIEDPNDAMVAWVRETDEMTRHNILKEIMDVEDEDDSGPDIRVECVPGSLEGQVLCILITSEGLLDQNPQGQAAALIHYLYDRFWDKRTTMPHTGFTYVWYMPEDESPYFAGAYFVTPIEVRHHQVSGWLREQIETMNV